MSYTVAQNTFFMTMASILQKIISFAYFTVIARLIGVTNTGQYFFAIAFTTIFGVIADFGLGPVLTREAAKHPENSQKFASTILLTRVGFGFFAYLLVVLSVFILNYSADLRLLICLSGITMFFDNIQTSFYSIFRAHRNLRYESFGMVASQFLTLLIGTIAILNHAPLYWLIIAYTVPSILNTLFGAACVRYILNIHLAFSWNKELSWYFLRLAFPFALAGFIGRLYSYADSILMSKMLGPEHLGWWSVPYKITFAFQFIPTALTASVYPAISALAEKDKAKVSDLFTKSWRYLFLLVLPLAGGIGALANPIIIRLYGVNFEPSVPILRFLVVSLIFTFLSFVNGSLLNALDRQKTQTALIALALTCNILLNLYLLPLFGVQGAAISAVIASFLLWLMGYIAVSKTIAVNHGAIAKIFWRTAWPAIVMAVPLYIFAPSVNFVALIVLGALLYCGLLLVSGGITKSDILLFYQKMFNRLPHITTV